MPHGPAGEELVQAGRDAHHYDVPSVPVYHPTEEEWANDPLEYINKIRPEAERYGVCNIVCPPSWQPEFRLPNKDELRFRTRIQAVNELQDRPAGPSKRARENAARARAALEAAGIDPATFRPGFCSAAARGAAAGWAETAAGWAAAAVRKRPPRPIRPRGARSTTTSVRMSARRARSPPPKRPRPVPATPTRERPANKKKNARGGG